MKLIAISGAKHSKKNLLAMKLSQNSDCIWILPYSDQPVRINSDNTEDKFIRLNKRQLDAKMNREKVLASVRVNEHRYIFFENQMNADYVVLIGDDTIIMQLKSDYDGKLVTIRCHSETEEHSDRALLSDKEFDIVYNYDTDDFDTLVFEVEDIYDYEVD